MISNSYRVVWVRIATKEILADYTMEADPVELQMLHRFARDLSRRGRIGVRISKVPAYV